MCTTWVYTTVIHPMCTTWVYTTGIHHPVYPEVQAQRGASYPHSFGRQAQRGASYPHSSGERQAQRGASYLQSLGETESMRRREVSLSPCFIPFYHRFNTVFHSFLLFLPARNPVKTSREEGIPAQEYPFHCWLMFLHVSARFDSFRPVLL